MDWIFYYPSSPRLNTFSHPLNNAGLKSSLFSPFDGPPKTVPEALLNVWGLISQGPKGNCDSERWSPEGSRLGGHLHPSKSINFSTLRDPNVFLSTVLNPYASHETASVFSQSIKDTKRSKRSPKRRSIPKKSLNLNNHVKYSIPQN